MPRRSSKRKGATCDERRFALDINDRVNRGESFTSP
jgi:hypothetical protein